MTGYKIGQSKMDLLTGTTPKTFSLLSIGQRGVGKTVFLAGSYAELHSNNQLNHPQQLWFDSQDSQVQENIERLLSYVQRTGQYPPSTIKITNFNFSLKHHTLWGTQTLCHFRWWDIPGESCKIQNFDFKKIVANSHGCCIFIDAYALMHNQAYLQGLEDIIETVRSIASLVSLNNLKYAFAVILTKCDLLEPSLISQQQLKEKLQPLLYYLNGVTNYQIFYSFIPIVHVEAASTLSATGAATPLLWLVWELSKAHTPGLSNNLLNLIVRLRSTDLQVQQELEDGSLQSLFGPWELDAQKILGVKKLITARGISLLLTLVAIVSLVGAISSFLGNYEQFFQRDPKNLDALRNVITLRQSGQFDQAVPLMEKLVQQEPKNLEFRLQLAQLYQLTSRLTKAETAYDQVLAQQKNNLNALVGKAMVRETQGDIKTSKVLFVQAEKAAPNANSKAKVRRVAQRWLKDYNP